MLKKLILIAVAGAATLGAAAPTFAQDGMFEPTIRIVKYDDLDLTNERARERLDTRLRSAANSACGFWQAHTLTEKRAAQACRKAALQRTEPKVAEAVRKAAARYARRGN
ncbi:MAG: UrcA family protein [Sphingopyxis sp.]|nr:UrcA family protein [Sphingopyxis sp.]